MYTISDVMRIATEQLKDSNIPDWRVSSEFILATALGVEKSEIYKVESITDKQFRSYMKLIKLRCRHIPLDKIIGYTDFMSLRIPYSKSVLTPRNETELLADRIATDIRKLYKKNQYLTPISMLDLCCGSGCLGLSVAHSTNVNATLSDISKKAIRNAMSNNEYNNKIRKSNNLPPINANFVVSDLFDGIEGKFDIIVCNPPYVKTGDLEGLEIEVRDFDPILALDGGKDGLDFYRKVIKVLPNFLNSDNGAGYIYFEVGVEQAESVAKMLEKDFENIEIVKDLSGIDRFVIARKRDIDVK